MSLSLNDVVDVKISVGPVSSVRSNFNLGLIVGPSKVISAEDRVKVYSSTSDMRIAGWSGTEPEFLAAEKYFSQEISARKIAIGVRAEESVGLLETVTEAVAKCRAANYEWYGLYVCGITDIEAKEIADRIESTSPESAFFFNTSSTDVITKAEGNVVEEIHNKSYKRTFSMYSNTDHAAAAVMGYAMGANSQAEGSSFTLANKKIVGVEPENIGSVQLKILESMNCNVYVSRGHIYKMLEGGKTASGISFDELIQFDMLKNDIQVSVINVLQNTSKIPQTDGGVLMLETAITEPLEKHRGTGFVTEGAWKGQPILGIKHGDILPRGYAIMTGSVNEQSQADREARKAPPIYVLVKLAGSIERAVIEVFANR